MYKTVCEAVQAPGGFAKLVLAAVRPVYVQPGLELSRNTCWGQGGEVGEGMCVHEEVSRELGRFLAKLMAKTFREALDGCLGSVIGRVTPAE
jgi:hypothetical protein